MKKEALSRKAYESPTLARHGSFSQLTLGSSDGDLLDQEFPVGTPRGDLTFS